MPVEIFEHSNFSESRSAYIEKDVPYVGASWNDKIFSKGPEVNNKNRDDLMKIRAEFIKKIGENIQKKSPANDINFGMKFAIYLTMIIISVIAVLSNSWIIYFFGMVGLGITFAHGVELSHQALHRLGFRNRFLNEVVGVALGLPMGVSFAEYQASHLRHHNLLGTPENKEFFNYGDQYGDRLRSRSSTIWLWLKRFSLLEHYKKVGQNIWLSALGRNFPEENDRVSRRIRRDYLILLAILLTMIGVSVAMGTALIVWVWILPLCLVAAPVHAAIELPEHFMCDTDSTDVLVNTRSIRSNAFMTWLTNGNNLHVEHHLIMGASIERLPDIHAVIAPYIKYYHESYLTFILSLFRGRLPSTSNADYTIGENA